MRCVFYLAIVATISWVAGGEEDEDGNLSLA